MSNAEDDQIARLHREAGRRCAESERLARDLVERSHRQALAEHEASQRRANELIDQLHHAAVAAGRRPAVPECRLLLDGAARQFTLEV